MVGRAWPRRRQRGQPPNAPVMQHDPVADVPSPIDLRKASDAADWAKSAMERRPWRAEFFRKFVEIIAVVPNADVLELGSGPGFLAQQLARASPDHGYTLLDFSEAMHDLARSRLSGVPASVRYVTRNFKDADWNAGLGPFDFVVTMQAVHELRHKAHAERLHSQVRQVLKPGGTYLVCDHYVGEDGMKNDQLYMSVSEQREALESAGFGVHEVLRLRGLVMHHAA